MQDDRYYVSSKMVVVKMGMVLSGFERYRVIEEEKGNGDVVEMVIGKLVEMDMLRDVESEEELVRFMSDEWEWKGEEIMRVRGKLN